jgi:hypothetical protein
LALPIGGVALVLLLHAAATTTDRSVATDRLQWRKYEKLAGLRLDLAQGLNLEGKAVERGRNETL